MLQIVVKYFLNEEGLNYFSDWFTEVKTISSQQDGFVDISYQLVGNIPVVTLYFTNEAKLMKWASSALHNKLVAKLDPFLTQPRKVEKKVLTGL